MPQYETALQFTHDFNYFAESHNFDNYRIYARSLRTDTYPCQETIQLRLVLSEWIRPYALDLSRHLGGGPGKLTGHSRRQIDHLNASAVEANLIQHLLHVLHSLASV